MRNGKILYEGDKSYFSAYTVVLIESRKILSEYWFIISSSFSPCEQFYILIFKSLIWSVLLEVILSLHSWVIIL